MNMVWHLLWKDIRRFKWWLVGWFGLTGIIWGLSATAGTSIYARFIFTFIPSALFSIFGYAFIIRVAQEDPPTGQTAFWLTRPIQRWALLLAKACFILLLLGLPSAFESVIAKPIQLTSFWDAYSCVCTIMFVFFVWITALCASRLFTALLASFAVIFIYTGFASGINALISMPAIMRGIIHGANVQELSKMLIGIITSKMLVQNVAAIILGAGIITYHYLTRRTTHVRIMSAVALIIVLALGGLWHKNIVPPSAISAAFSQRTEIEKRVRAFLEAFPLFEKARLTIRDAQKLIDESQKLLNVEKADPTTMAKDQAEVAARFSGFNWETIVDVNFDNGIDEGLTAKAADPGLQWSVTNQCERIAGTSTLGKWAGGKVQLSITNDTRALIEVSGDFKISKSSGYQLIALGCGTKAGTVAMFFEGDKGTGCFYYKDKIMSRSGYCIQQRFIKIPVKMEKELSGFEFGNEMQVFHKMRIVLDRAESRIYYYVDDQLLGILKYTGNIGTITSIWMDLEARDKNTELDVLYDNLRARVAGDTYPD